MLFIRMVSIKNGTAIAARMGGKLKTILYITTCFYTFALDIYAAAECSFLDNIQAFATGRTILYGLSALAAYISFVDYLVHFGAALKGKK
jgi:CDP-diacylglycerol--glycerol-3-phosphate 3-phosphatidyltransferase